MMTDNGRGVTVHFLHESDMQASMFSDQFAQIESKLNLCHSRTGIHDPSARVAAISTFDKEIDAARQSLRSLITRRNAIVPISLLPPEILARVFHFLVLEEPPLTGTRNLGWIGVTHVCQHWRQVALDDSSLWARIWGIPTNTKWISEMLARAKDAPLDIKLNAIRKTSEDALHMILLHLYPTRQLRLHNLSTSTLHSDNVREIFGCEAPDLEHFEIAATAFPPITFPKIGGSMLFKGRTPRLRTFSLRVTRVKIPWSLIPRGQLTQLKIARPKEDFDSPSDSSQLVDLLVNCPALEILALDSCIPSQLGCGPGYERVHLPHLSHLHLCGSTYRIINMVEMLKPPSSTTFHLDCIHESIHSEAEGILLVVIASRIKSPAPIKFTSLTVTTRCTSSLNITASTFRSTLQNRQTQNFEGDVAGNAELVLSFDKLFNQPYLLPLACEILPISNLEFLSMSAINRIDINWVELFSCCTNVTTMQAIGRGTSSLVRALTAPTVTNAGSSKEGREEEHDNRESTLVQPASTAAHAHAPMFPKLEFLELTELNFSEGKHPSGILFDVFERGLQLRMVASGARLKLLRISDCDISTEHANDLQKLVQDFHWDENEGLIDSDGSDSDRWDGYTDGWDGYTDRWDDYTDRWDDYTDRGEGYSDGWLSS